MTLLNVTTDKPVLELVGHTRGVTGVAYSPNDDYIATTSADDTMRALLAASRASVIAPIAPLTPLEQAETTAQAR